MNRLKLLGILLLGGVLSVFGWSLRPEPAQATPFYTRDVIAQHVLAQGMAPLGAANCSSSTASCLVASLTSGGAISGPTLTATAALGFVAIPTSGCIILDGSATCATAGTDRITHDGTNTALMSGGSTFWTCSNGTGVCNNSFGWASSIASGSNGFAITTNGARIDYGAGASDYMSSDGSSITSAANFIAPSFQSSGTNTFSGATAVLTSNTTSSFFSQGTGQMTWDLNASDATRTASVPALALKCDVDAAAGDACIGVKDSAGTVVWTVNEEGEMVASSTKQRGTITLSGGTGTATVLSGAICVCTDRTANASVKCAVSSTTLTATGTTTDVIAYICL